MDIKTLPVNHARKRDKKGEERKEKAKEELKGPSKRRGHGNRVVKNSF